MRTVVLGSQGQLGRDLVPLLAGDVMPLTREHGDLTKPEMLRATLQEARPDVVINCAAYNFVDRAESEPEACFAVNAFGMRNLALICGELGCRLVHYSTDFVFGLDATRQAPWKETDAPGPISVYGASKLAGEYFVRSLCPNHLVIRTCGLFGLHGTGGKGGNFVETMLRVAGQGKPFRVVDDQRCTPTFTVDLAEATMALLAKGANGLFHATNSGDCSWYEFSKAIFEISAVSADLTPIPSSQYPTAARRPAYSVLAPAHLIAAGLAPLRLWRDALADYLHQREARNRLTAPVGGS